MNVKMQNIYFLAKDGDTMLKMMSEVYQEFAQECLTRIRVVRVSNAKLTVETPLCVISFVDMSKADIDDIRGYRCDTVVIDNAIRIHDTWFSDVIEPLISCSRMKRGENEVHYGMFIGWYQFMGDKGILKYANCDRYDFDTQCENTYERISRKDYFRKDVVRFGEWGQVVEIFEEDKEEVSE